MLTEIGKHEKEIKQGKKTNQDAIDSLSSIPFVILWYDNYVDRYPLKPTAILTAFALFGHIQKWTTLVCNQAKQKTKYYLKKCPSQLIEK